MEFKKCVRCGCFFMSNNDVCCNCELKDKNDISKLNTFIENSPYSSAESLSIETGISKNNINRFIENNSINGFNTKV